MVVDLNVAHIPQCMPLSCLAWTANAMDVRWLQLIRKQRFFDHILCFPGYLSFQGFTV